MPATGAGWIALASVAAVTVTAVQTQQAQKSAKKAAAKGREQIERQRKLTELQAGEYLELTEKQMQLQALQSQTRTLSELIDRQDAERQPQIYTLPTAQPTSAVERINIAIDDFIKGL